VVLSDPNPNPNLNLNPNCNPNPNPNSYRTGEYDHARSILVPYFRKGKKDLFVQVKGEPTMEAYLKDVLLKISDRKHKNVSFTSNVT
jgi:hypothetical protein